MMELYIEMLHRGKLIYAFVAFPSWCSNHLFCEQTVRQICLKLYILFLHGFQGSPMILESNSRLIIKQGPRTCQRTCYEPVMSNLWTCIEKGFQCMWVHRISAFTVAVYHSGFSFRWCTKSGFWTPVFQWTWVNSHKSNSWWFLGTTELSSKTKNCYHCPLQVWIINSVVRKRRQWRCCVGCRDLMGRLWC